MIFDEIQHLKNDASLQTKAARTIARQIVKNNFSNKIIFISGTPFDKKEQHLTFFKNCGIVTKSN